MDVKTIETRVNYRIAILGNTHPQARAHTHTHAHKAHKFAVALWPILFSSSIPPLPLFLSFFRLLSFPLCHMHTHTQAPGIARAVLRVGGPCSAACFRRGVVRVRHLLVAVAHYPRPGRLSTLGVMFRVIKNHKSGPGARAAEPPSV